MQRVLVYGAGVVGSVYAAGLKGAGVDVTLLARGDRFTYLREHGLVLQDAETGATRTIPIDVIDALEPGDTYDLIMVIVRKNQLGAVLPVLARNSSPNIIFMLNSASGPEEIVGHIGRERVMLGFVAAGGQREGQLVRYILLSRLQPTTIGEIDGEITPRLCEAGALLCRAGFPVAYERHIDWYLKTHAALVIPIAMAVYAAGGSTKQVSQRPDVMRLMVEAIKEGVGALRAQGVTPTPLKYRLVSRLPTWLLAMVLRRGFASERSEVIMAAHANAAKDEMHHLYLELRGAIARTAAPTPAFDRLANMAWAKT